MLVIERNSQRYIVDPHTGKAVVFVPMLHDPSGTYWPVVAQTYDDADQAGPTGPRP